MVSTFLLLQFLHNQPISWVFTCTNNRTFQTVESGMLATTSYENNLCGFLKGGLGVLSLFFKAFRAKFNLFSGKFGSSIFSVIVWKLSHKIKLWRSHNESQVNTPRDRFGPKHLYAFFIYFINMWLQEPIWSCRSKMWLQK